MLMRNKTGSGSLMKHKTSFTKLTQLWGIIFILGVTVSITAVDIAGSWHDFSVRSREIREEHISRNKQLVKQEVRQVVNLIHHAINKNVKMARQELRTEVQAAYATAENIYRKNRGIYSDAKIQGMILDALRPIQFDNGLGRYFIVRLDGTVIMFPEQPEQEGRNLCGRQDPEGRYVIRDMTNLVRTRDHGFYEYVWSKPEGTGGNLKKIAFVKLFKPYNWAIGTDLYLSDIEKLIENNLLSVISSIRFGREGYIFINRLNGDAMVSNGKVTGGKLKLWEFFNRNPQRMKRIFDMEYKAAMEPEGDFIAYHHPKLTQPDRESPKVSFIYGIPELKWLVGAGVYLDDLEVEIATMQERLTRRILEKIVLFSVIALGIAAVFLIMLNSLNQKLKHDMDLFISFFRNAVQSSEPIERERVQFREFDRIAKYANRMLDDRSKIEEALRCSETKFRDLVETSCDLIWEVEADSYIRTYVSPQIEDMLGYRPDEVIGRPFTDFMPEKNIPALISKLEEVAAQRGSIKFLEQKLQRKDGTEIIIESNAVPFFHKNGKLAGYRGVDRDVTERRLADEELQKMRQLTSIGTLAGGIAHDFNNILMGIFGNIELARLNISTDHPAYRFIVSADMALQRATKLTRQLLTFARGGDPLLEAVDLQEIVKTSVTFNLTGSSVKAHFSLPDDLWQVKADKGQLDQVIANLIINAKQAMPEGGSIYIEARNIEHIQEPSAPHLSGSFVKLAIRDQGTGISEKYLDRIFDPYFTTKQTGSGLGLATVHGIIKKHGGHIKVESTPDRGTLFEIFLPAEKQGGTEDSAHAARKKRTDNNRAASGRVLIMDDEEMVREVAGAMLEQFGYEYGCAADGQEALEKYTAAKENGRPFDVVILDLTIPGGMGGKKAIKKLLETDPHTRAIVASGYSTDPVMAHFSAYGFCGRVVKPFDLQSFKHEIERVMKQDAADS